MVTDTQTTLIDKMAFIYVKDQKVLISLTRGKDTWYLPGGKRDPGETDEQTLIREVKEELNVDLLPQTIKYYGTFEAPAHGKPGMTVRMTCYTAEFTGELAPTNEIEKLDFFSYAQKNLTSPVDNLIFDDLYAKGLIT